MNNETVNPVGAAFVGPWDETFNERPFAGTPAAAPVLDHKALHVHLTGTQHRSGTTVTNIGIRDDTDREIAQLTPQQARSLADLLTRLACQAEAVDISEPNTPPKPGYYPQFIGKSRYWDGTQWLNSRPQRSAKLEQRRAWFANGGDAQR